MARQVTTFDARSTRTDVLSSYVGESIERRKRLAEDLAPHVPAVVVAMIEAARGLWVEEELPVKPVQDPNGPTRRLVFQIRPNVKAQTLFFEYAGYDVGDLGNALLSLSKVAEAQANVKAGLSSAKVRNLNSQTKMNLASAEVFSASLIEEEDMNSAVKSVFAACLAYIQTYPVDMMRQVVETDAGYQQWQAGFAKDANKALALALGIDPEETPQLPPGEEVEEEAEA
jgi:hypothetical protein